MKCPNCKKQSVCFCSNCKKRRNMPQQRSERVCSDGESLKCPYCKSVYHIGYLEDLAFEEYKKLENNG